MSIFDRIEESLDMDVFMEDYKEAEETGGEFKEVPEGIYDVEVNKMEVGVSKAGNPQVIIWFKIVDGEYKNNLIFTYHGIASGQRMYFTNKFISSLETEVDLSNWHDENGRPRFEIYADRISEVFDEVLGNIYTLEYTKNDKGFNQYNIISKVSQAEDLPGYSPVSNDDVPF